MNMNMNVMMVIAKRERWGVCVSWKLHGAGGGSMVGAVGGSTQREPLVVGKPSTFMMDYLANE